MKLMKAIHKKESGQAFILVLILLLLGGLMLGPLLAFMSTGLKAGQAYEEKMDELYAADAGVEDAIHKMITDDASLEDLGEGESHSYTVTGPVNGISPVDVTVTKLSLIQGLLGEKEYKLDQPHEDWIDVPVVEPTPYDEEGYVEYYCEIAFDYQPEEGEGVMSRQIQTVGAFFSPPPGSEDLVTSDSPYDYNNPEEGTPWGKITFDKLESTETKIAGGGFAFIWRWQQNKGPIFTNGDTGGFSFKFKVDDPDWRYRIYFIWATVKEQDISYVTSGDFWKWLIEATAGGTTVQSAIVQEIVGETSAVEILTWEINPPH